MPVDLLPEVADAPTAPRDLLPDIPDAPKAKVAARPPRDLLPDVPDAATPSLSPSNLDQVIASTHMDLGESAPAAPNLPTEGPTVNLLGQNYRRVTSDLSAPPPDYSSPAYREPARDAEIGRIAQNVDGYYESKLGRPLTPEELQHNRQVAAGASQITPQELRESQAVQSLDGKSNVARAAGQAASDFYNAGLAAVSPESAEQFRHDRALSAPLADTVANKVAGAVGGIAASLPAMATGAAAVPLFTAHGAVSGVGTARTEALRQREAGRQVSGSDEAKAAAAYGTAQAASNLVAAKLFGAGGKSVPARVASQVAVNAALGTGGKVAENAVARQTIDPNRKIGEGALQAGAMGGLQGAIFAGAGELGHLFRGKIPAEHVEALQRAKTPEEVQAIVNDARAKLAQDAEAQPTPPGSVQPSTPPTPLTPQSSPTPAEQLATPAALSPVTDAELERVTQPGEGSSSQSQDLLDERPNISPEEMAVLMGEEAPTPQPAEAVPPSASASGQAAKVPDITGQAETQRPLSIAERADKQEGFKVRRERVKTKLEQGKTVSRSELRAFLNEPWADQALAAMSPAKAPTAETSVTNRRAELMAQLKRTLIEEHGPDIADTGSTVSKQQAYRDNRPELLLSDKLAMELAGQLPADHPGTAIAHNLAELAKNPRGTKLQAFDPNQLEDGSRVVVSDKTKPLTVNHSNGTLENDINTAIPPVIVGKKVLPPLEPEGSAGRFEPDELTQALVESGVEPARAAETVKKLVAHHASPHNFDKFDASKIGTGEGAQAYGHGLYFAGQKEVADFYKSKLEPGRGASPEDVAKRILDAPGINGDRAKAIAEAEDRLAKAGVGSAWTPSSNDPTLRQALDVLKSGKRIEGTVYQVELAPREDELLDWDKPLSQQSEHVRKALEKFEKDEPARFTAEQNNNGTFSVRGPGGQYGVYQNLPEAQARIEKLQQSFEPTGQTVYGRVAYAMEKAGKVENPSLVSSSEKAASNHLRSLGIRGIKYLDQSSRASGEGSRNYVIFDDADVTITHKNDVPVTAQETPHAAAQGNQFASPAREHPTAQDGGTLGTGGATDRAQPAATVAQGTDASAGVETKTPDGMGTGRGGETVATGGTVVEPAPGSQSGKAPVAEKPETVAAPVTQVEKSTTPVVKRADPRAAVFRKQAESLTKIIEDKHRPMTQNATPKRMREYRQRTTEGDALERVQRAFHAMADAREAGTLPPELENVKSKSQVAGLVARKMKHNGGYYDAYFETSEYENSSPQAKALQSLLEKSSQTPETIEANAEKVKARKIADAEQKIQFQKIEGFFPTPKPLIDKMLAKADVRSGMKVLEPSAGKGDIADELRRRGAKVDTVEIRPSLQDILKAKEHTLVGEDFLQHTGQYDRIVMNPPFERGQDMEHVQHAWEQLKPGGKLVAIMSEGTFGNSSRKAQEFRQWLNERGGTSEKVDPGTFSGAQAFRQTGVATRLVEIEKPSAKKFYEDTSPQQTGVFGQPVALKDTGAQQPMVYETDSKPAELPPREVVGSKEANREENTAQMFPKPGGANQSLSAAGIADPYMDPASGKSSLKNLTETIAKATPSGASLGQRQRIGATTAENASKAPGIASRAAAALVRVHDGIKGSMAALFDAYRNPPSTASYDKATRYWSGADNISALEIQRYRKAALRSVPNKLDRGAIAIYIEAGGDQAKLDTWAKDIASDPKTRRYAPIFDRATRLSDEHKVIAQATGVRNDATLNEAQDAGLLKQGVDDYMMHVWADSPKMLRQLAAQANWTSLQTRPGFTKQRTIPTYYDGIKLGMTSRDLDFAGLTAAHERAFRQALAARAYIKSLHERKAADWRPLATISNASAREVPAEGQSEAFLIRPNAKPGEEFADYRMVDHPALRGWRWAAKDSEGKPIFVQGDMLVHPDIYRSLKNNLTPSAIQNFEVHLGDRSIRPGAAVMRVGTELKHAILSFSGFHQTTLGIHAAEHRVAPAFMPEIDLENPVHKGLIDHGLMVAHYGAEEAFGEGVASGGLVTKVPGIGPAYRAYTDYLFKDYLPRLKMAMASHALERNTKRYPNLSKDQLYSLTADQSNAAFGGINLRVLGRNKTFQDVLRLTLMAPDFLEARGRFVGQALKPYGREQTTALALGAVTLYTAAAVLNQMLDGDPHLNKPFTLVYHGKDYELRTIQGDLDNLVRDPAGFARNRLSPVASFAVKTLAGTDRYGKKTPVKEQVKAALKENAPIPAQAWLRGKNDTTGERIANTILKMVGVNMRKEQKDSRPARKKK